MLRRVFSLASVVSLLLCLATMTLWVRSEWVESYAWAGRPGPRSAVIAIEFGHLIINTCGDWPGGSSWRATSEQLGTSAYRVGVIPDNLFAATDKRDFNSLGIASIN